MSGSGSGTCPCCGDPWSPGQGEQACEGCVAAGCEPGRLGAWSNCERLNSGSAHEQMASEIKAGFTLLTAKGERVLPVIGKTVGRVNVHVSTDGDGGNWQYAFTAYRNRDGVWKPQMRSGMFPELRTDERDWSRMWMHVVNSVAGTITSQGGAVAPIGMGVLMSADEHLSEQQFPMYHGTRASMNEGDLITPGRRNNYAPGKSDHVYGTRELGYAKASAINAKPYRNPVHVYEVEPTGDMDRDPEQLAGESVSGMQTPPARQNFRSAQPFRVLREVWGAPAHVNMIGGRVIE